MTDKAKLGKFGEDVACSFLTSHGFEIKERNFRLSRDEIDIIAQDENFFIFVEVKTRTQYGGGSTFYGTPGTAVNSTKRSNTLRACHEYLRKFCVAKQPRIDVIEVYIKQGGYGDPQILDVRHIRNAFDAKGRKH